jgi:hypothetical protein
LDDHHHRTAAERDEMRAREANRQRQEQWEREHDLRAQPEAPNEQRNQPESTQAPVVGQPDKLSWTEKGRAIGSAALERADYVANETSIGDSLPLGTGPAIKGIRTGWEQREAIRADAKNALDEARKIAGAAGRDAGEAMGRAVHQIRGDPLDPFVEMKVNEALEQQERQERNAQTERPPSPDR